MTPRPSALEAAKRCSCKPCQPKLALAIERAIREAGNPLAEAIRSGNSDVMLEALGAWEKSCG